MEQKQPRSLKLVEILQALQDHRDQEKLFYYSLTFPLKIALIYDIPIELIYEKTLGELEKITRLPPKPSGWDNFIWGERMIG